MAGPLNSRNFHILKYHVRVRRLSLLIPILLGIALHASAFSGRTLSPLRFRDQRIDYSASIATDGQSFLVVGVYGWFPYSIYGRIITAQGVSGKPFFISPGDHAEAVWNGHAYLVIVQDADYSVDVVTISRSGGGVVSVEHVWEDTPAHRQWLAVGWNGRRVILTSNDTPQDQTGGHGRIQILDGDGHPLGKPVAQAFGSGDLAPIFSTSDGFIAVNFGFYETHLERISDNGVIDPKPVIVPPTPGVVVQDGKRNLYFYAMFKTGKLMDVFLQVVDVNGAAGPPQLLFTTLSVSTSKSLSAALVGSRLLVSYGEFRATDVPALNAAFVHVFEVGKDGTLTAVGSPIQLTTKSDNTYQGRFVSRIVCNAQTCAYWLAGDYPSALRVIPTAELASTRPDEGEVVLEVDNAVNQQTQPVIAAGDDGYLAAWNEHDATDHWQAITARVNADGQTIQRNGLRMPNSKQSELSVAWGNGQWLVAFGNQAIRVDAAGNAVDAQPFPTGVGRTMAVAWSGSSWLVAGVLPNGHLSAVEVRTEGSVGVLQTVFRSADYDPSLVSDCALVWDGSGYFLPFITGYYSSQGGAYGFHDGRVYATRLSDQGVPIQPVPLLLSTKVGGESVVCAVSRGGTTHVAWSTYDGSTSGRQSTDTFILELSATSPLRVNGVPGRIGGGVLQSLTSDGHGGYRLIRSVSDPYAIRYYFYGVLDVLLLTPGVFVYGERQTSIAAERADVACRDDDCAVVVGALSHDNQNQERAELLFVRELTPTQPPATPQIHVARTGGGVEVWWDRIPDALGYLVEAADAGEGFHVVDATTRDGTGMLVESAAVTVRVKAWNYGGLSPATTMSVPSPPRRRASSR